MKKFLITRGLGGIGVFIALVTIVFAIQTLVPGDPIRARVGPSASAEVVAAERERFGLDDPIGVQYASYVKELSQGNLGESIRTRRGVRTDIARALPATLELAAVSMLFALAGAALIGMVGVAHARTGGGMRFVFIVGASAPSFLLGLIFLYVFFLRLGWLPPSGRNPPGTRIDSVTGMVLVDAILRGDPSGLVTGLRHTILPAMSLAFLPAVAIGRVLLSSLEEVYRQDYIRTAESKGLTPRSILWHHGVRNSLTAPLTMTGLQLGLLLGGVVVVEKVFSWPGLGLYMTQAIDFGDVTAIAGVTLVVGTVYIIVNAIVDLLQAVADPRIRL